MGRVRGGILINTAPISQTDWNTSEYSVYTVVCQSLESKAGSVESGVGVRETFWYGLGKDSNLYLLTLYTVAADIHGMRHFGPIVVPQYNKSEMVAAPSDHAAYG
jgi:hypothetical protein